VILAHVIRTHIECDVCHRGFTYVDGDITAGLLDRKWAVDGERHTCPKCARKAS
jgi:hypothetical protein